jgi:type I restriction enzyme M protein
LGGSKGNQTLREELGWDEATYDAVKNDLVVSGRLIPGRGRGGSVAIAPA